MAYKIEKLSLDKMWLATMEITVPDYSRNLYLKAIDSLRNELIRLNVELTEPEYNFTVAYDSEDRIELVDVKLFIAVKEPIEDLGPIKFVQEKPDELIRIVADSFVDVHTGIAEWMHEHDYVADGDMRRVVDAQQEYVFDCPYKRADD